MVRRGHDVPQEDYPLAAVIEHYHLVSLGMSVGNGDVQARENFGVPVQHRQLAAFLDRREVVDTVADVAPLVGIACLVPASLLHVILGLGEGRGQLPARSKRVQPPLWSK